MPEYRVEITPDDKGVKPWVAHVIADTEEEAIDKVVEQFQTLTQALVGQVSCDVVSIPC